MAGVKRINTSPLNYTDKAANLCMWLVFIIGLLHFFAALRLIPQILPLLPQMRILTAVLLMLSSLSLWIFQKNYKSGRTVLRITALVIILASLFSLWTSEKSGLYPLRMALLTSLVFLILGIIFILLANNTRHQDNIVHVLLIPAAAFSYFGLFSYILNVYDLFHIGQITISPGAVLSLFLLCLAILFLKNNTWLMKILSGPHLGSVMGRRLLPWILPIPVVVAILKIKVEQHGIMSSEALIMIVSIFYTIFLLTLLLTNAHRLNRIDKFRQKAEEALQKSEHGLTTLLKASSNAIYRMSPDWKTAYSITGQLFNPAENKPFDPGEYIPKEDLPEVVKRIDHAIKNKGLFELEHRVFFPDGTIGWNHSRAVPILDRNGNVEEWFGYAINITDQKRAEAALFESQQRYSTLFANKLIGIAHSRIITNQQGNIEDLLYLQVNDGYERMFGVRRADVEGHTMREVYQEVNMDFFKYLEKYFRVGVEGVEEMFETYFKPTRQYLSIYAYSPKPGEVISLLTDVTEKIKAEEMIRNYNINLEEKVRRRTIQLEKARKRAESADKLKTSFLLNMSHELRTPLNSIIGFSGILLRHLAGPLNTEQEKQLEMVQKSGRHLLSLINDILDISKIDAGELKPQFESFDFEDSIEDVKKLIQPLADIRGVKVFIVKRETIGQIITDKKRIRQIFINLLNNAIKFTEEGSVTITSYWDNNCIVTEITDTGIGIREEDLEKLFNPFTQLENNLTRKFEGSGLGLSITKKLLDMLHGTISVKSEFGVGSTFTVKLPVKK